MTRVLGRVMLAGLVIGCLACGSRRAAGYTPDSPRVQRMVKKAIAYLESDPPGSYKSFLGSHCLVGLALLKDGAPPSHPLIVKAVQRCQTYSGDRSQIRGDDPIYSLCLAIIFLCELAPEQYGSEIETLLAELQQRQKPHGGWGYKSKSTGDTSQTQYGVLAAWAAHRAEFAVSQDAVERVLLWLIRTQDPSGAWGYQGEDPGEGDYHRVKQDVRVSRLSLNAAALGSVYIAADLLRLVAPRETQQDPDKPGALRLVRDDAKEAAKKALTDRVPRDMLARALTDGNRTFAQRFRIDTAPWQYYYLYGLERYMSFREYAEGAAYRDSGWYDRGVELLAQRQAADGSFTIPPPSAERQRTGEIADEGPVVGAAFAVLFLLRSTQKSIEKVAYSQGALIGGRGLPRDASDVHLQDGKVVRAPIFGKVEDLLSILEDPNSSEFEDLVKYNRQLTLGADEASRQRGVDRLTDLVRRGDFRARQLAVRTLARSGDLDNTPVLIYALSDPDPRVAREARDGLRFLSRKFEGFGMPDRPDDAQRRDAIERWKQWYLSIRPDAKFID